MGNSTEKLKPLTILCQGGMDEIQHVAPTNPGAAVYLQNFESNRDGGYRRINGFAKYSSTAVTGSGKILGVCVFGDTVIAARENTGSVVEYHEGTGTSWTKINSDSRTVSAFPVQFIKYSWTGASSKIITVDGTNKPAMWDGSTWTVIDDSGSGPDDPKSVAEYKNHIFYAGATANLGEIVWCAPNDENNFDPADGAGALVVGDEVVGMYGFRDQLIIFGKSRLYRLTGSSIDDFAVLPISNKGGCVSAASIQEVNNDIVYMSYDGIRTVAATERIGDFELGNISTAISGAISELSTARVNGVVLRTKSQYRLFFPEESQTVTNSKGILGSLNRKPDGSIGWEWSVIKGIKASCADSDIISGAELVVHGGYDGYVYKQEEGVSFDGTAISALYITPEIDFGDPGLRKFIHRVIPYITREGASMIDMTVRFDYNSSNRQQPNSYSLAGTTSTSLFGTATFGTSVFGTQGDITERKLVEGSGFWASIVLVSNSVTDVPYTIEAFTIEAQAGGRR